MSECDDDSCGAFQYTRSGTMNLSESNDSQAFARLAAMYPPTNRTRSNKLVHVINLEKKLTAALAELARLRAQVAGGSDAWAPFADLLRTTASATDDASSSSLDRTSSAGDKMLADPKYFVFGSTKEFLYGLSGLAEDGLTRSMEEEFALNEGGRWKAEYDYVVHRAATEDVDAGGGALQDTTLVHYNSISSSGCQVVRDAGHGGMVLEDFCQHEKARAAELTRAEVAALRLYSGPSFRPLNHALRTKCVADWATTIACCYSGVLKLSFQSQPARVYRGVREAEMGLPPGFLECEEGGFAGGVELAFMSTTKSAAVALDYSGGGTTQGSIFTIDFDMTSRGASIQWLSQYPHEEELLFPPFTGLSCTGLSQHGAKRLVQLSAQVSTARPDTREIDTPEYVPGTDAARRRVAALLELDSGAAAEMQAWDLEGKVLDSTEAQAALALLLGRTSAVAAPCLRHLNLAASGLGPEGVERIAEALGRSEITLERLNLTACHAADAGVAALARASELSAALATCTVLMLGENEVTDAGLVSLASALARGGLQRLESLHLEGNQLIGGGLEKLADACTSSDALRRCTVLDLRRNRLSDSGVAALARGCGPLIRLEQLLLAVNEIGDLGLSALAAATVTTGGGNSGGMLGALRVLDLETNNFGSAGLTALAEKCGAGGLAKLCKLCVGGNEVGDDGLAALARACAVAQTVIADLRELKLRGCGIGDAGLAALADALTSGGIARIESLDLGGNDIGDPGLAALADACRAGALARVETLRLEENSISDEGVVPLADACADVGALGRLRTLHLNINELGDASLKAISHAGERGAMAQLQTIQLEWNSIGDAGLSAFAKAIESGAFPRLTALKLLDNYFSDDGLVALAPLLAEKLSHLTELSIGKNLTDDGMRLLCEACADGALPDIQKLCLNSNEFTNVGLKALAAACDGGAFPSLEVLGMDEGALGVDHPKLKAACKRRGLALE
jgi:Ran GTPase-activating protein (RanGAP) involved in mRNA processing and transport